MFNRESSVLTIALPSKGALEKSALSFLEKSGMRVYKPNPRQYAAVIPSQPGVEVIFQRVTDIFRKVEDGSIDLGITGYDIVREYGDESDEVIVVSKLGFGACRLVAAVPDSWLDVSSVNDLVGLSVAYKDSGRKLRIATKYHSLTRDWLYRSGIMNFTLVNADGALEAAPQMGYADMIIDLTETGTTLRENRLKTLDGGTIVESEAVLIANMRSLQNPDKLELMRHMLELIDAHLSARRYISVKANIRGESEEQVGSKLAAVPELAGLVGPSVTPIYPKLPDGESWFEITILIEARQLLPTVEHIRAVGGSAISVVQPMYVFDEESSTYRDLVQQLQQIAQTP